MYNLICSEFFRFRKNKLFWISIFASLAFGIFFGITVAPNGILEHGTLDHLSMVTLVLVMGTFFSLAFGRDYSDGTIRNKIIAGKGKGRIFLAKYIVGILVSSIFTAVFIIPFIVIAGKPLLNVLPPSILLLALLNFVLINYAWASIFTLISSLCSTKEKGILINIFAIVVIIVGASQIDFVLIQPENFETTILETVEMIPEEVDQIENGIWEGKWFKVTDSEGKTTYYKDEVPRKEVIDNPRYIGNPTRDVLQAIQCILPHGQVTHYVSYLKECIYGHGPEVVKSDYVAWFPLYSAILIFALGVLGSLLFRKKEVK